MKIKYWCGIGLGLFFICYVGVLWLNIGGWKVRVVKRINPTPAASQTVDAKVVSKTGKIIFVNWGSRLLNQQHFLPNHHNLNETLPTDWKILDLLNFYYVNWQNFYHIDPKTLLKPILDKGRVYFQPLPNLLVKWLSPTQLKLTELTQITNLSSEINEKLYQLIKKPKISQAVIKAFLKRKLSSKKTDQIWQRLQAQIIFGT